MLLIPLSFMRREVNEEKRVSGQRPASAFLHTVPNEERIKEDKRVAGQRHPSAA